MEYKICHACAKQINKKAIKCCYCSTYQNWRRHGVMIISGTGLALTAFSILATPIVKDFFDSKRPDIHVSILDGDGFQTSFMVSNSGTQPAGLMSIEIKTFDKSGVRQTFFLESELDRKLIEAGKAYVVTASNGTLIPNPLSHETRALIEQRHIQLEENCSLTLNYVQINGTKVIKDFPFFCNAHSMKIPINIEAEKGGQKQN